MFALSGLEEDEASSWSRVSGSSGSIWRQGYERSPTSVFTVPLFMLDGTAGDRGGARIIACELVEGRRRRVLAGVRWRIARAPRSESLKGDGPGFLSEAVPDERT